ncbi:MAG: hypothetical protein JWO84_109 [Parcubacteria group bacterium]|nr:hypothetical protein [Parcubacteria group bacterium]
MSEASLTLEQLRDLHLNLALDFEFKARSTADSSEEPFYLDKREEAFVGALYFEDLIEAGIRDIPPRTSS